MKSIPEFNMARLLSIVRCSFSTILDYRNRKVRFSLQNTLMAVLAMFSLKFSSLLTFDQQHDDKVFLHNIGKLFGVKEFPSDTWTRELLDKIDPKSLEESYRALHHHVEQSGGLEPYRYLGDYIFITIDGSGYFCSDTVNCPYCYIKTRSNGKVEYHHYLLTAGIVHPNLSQVLPLPPEFILRSDGSTKNDCETNALNRMLLKIREFYPTQKIIILLDGLYANGPVINSLKEKNFNYIIVLKENNHQALFENVHKNLRLGKIDEFEVQNKGKGCDVLHGYRYLNGVQLNKSNPDIKVNYLDHWEIITDKNGKEKGNYQCLWITDLLLTQGNVGELSMAGRARWKSENETHNTLKNQGYNLEHNYGHGKEHLSSVIVMLMILSFFMDQIQELGCTFFKAARKRCQSRQWLWERLRAFFTTYLIDAWEILFEAIARGHRVVKLEVDDSS